MPITVTSACGRSFTLKDELAGKLMKCPECGEELRVPGGAGAAPSADRFSGLDPVFMRRKFLLRQKHLAISDKYYVWDETGNTLLFVLRPARFIRGCLSILAGLAAAGIVAAAGITLAGGMEKPAGGILVGITLVAALAALFCVAIPLSPKRHVYFYRDDTQRELLLQVEQDQKFAPIVATYTIKDAAGAPLARLRKNYLYNLFRKRWYCLSPEGRIMSVIKEDSILLSLLRRVLGPFFGLLRTNFIFLKGESEEIIGEFNRKLTLLDRYVLDMSLDAGDHLDPRIALATGVMLDTGERR